MIDKELRALELDTALVSTPEAELLEDITCWLTLRAIYSEEMQEVFLGARLHGWTLIAIHNPSLINATLWPL